MAQVYPLTCLLIDDDEDDQELFADALAQLPNTTFRTVFANDGAAALQLLKDELTPHYIFLDLNMPRLNGMQCLDKMKQLAHLKEIPIVIYSTSIHEENKKRALEMGAAAFITKPNRFTELVQKLSDYFVACGIIPAM